MTPTALDRVFGRSRLKMVTGPYVEVYREATAPGSRRRYTKRFIKTREGDFREWTEREWRILARLVGHGARHVPDVVQYDRGAAGGDALVQTYDAGITVDHWATLLPVQRGALVQRHIFQDCAHWWALARHLLLALHEIHALKLVHLDLKADNICLPFAPPGFHPGLTDRAQPEVIYPVFEQLALIDFAFSLVSGEALTSPLPIGWQRVFPYQSPRLLAALDAGHRGDLEPTRQLDWRCDMYSLAALLACHLPGPEGIGGSPGERGWTAGLHDEALALLRKIRRSHEFEAGSTLPHLEMAADCARQLASPALDESLSLGWQLASDVHEVDAMAPTAPLTPVTLIEPHIVSAAPVTEIFVRREATAAASTVPAPAAGAAATVPADPPPAGATADDAAGAALDPDHGGLATEPAVHAAVPSMLPPSIDLPASSSAAGAGMMPGSPQAGRRVEIDVTSPTPVVQAEPAVVAVSPTPSIEQTLPLTRRGWRPRAALRYGLPLAGLVAASVWLVTGLDESSRQPPGPASDATQVVAGKNTAPVPAASALAPMPSAAPVQPAPTVEASGQAAQVAKAPDRPGPDAGNAAPATPAATAEAVLPDRPGPRAASYQPPVQPRLPEDRYARRAQAIVAQVVPAVVQRAAPRIGEVLSAAAQAQNAADDRRTLAAAGAIGDAAFSEAELRLTAADSSAQARQLNAAAHKAFWQGGDAERAFQLQWQAFGAQPQDPEIAGNLAFYAMNLNPRQVEMARGLAIYALAAATRSTGPSRLEDWGSLAVANALSGRQDESANAMLVLLTVSKDVNRSCRSALSSVASFGPALKEPAQALLSRVNARGVGSAPYCELPPKWNLGSKLP